jgi:hypothetical protein
MDESPDGPKPAPHDLSRRQLIQGALAVGGLGTATRWNKPLVEAVMGGVHKPNTCQCSGSTPKPPPLERGCCRNHSQAVTTGCKGKCCGSMCQHVGCSCVNQSKWTCIDNTWRRDKTTTVGCG